MAFTQNYLQARFQTGSRCKQVMAFTQNYLQAQSLLHYGVCQIAPIVFLNAN